MYQLMYKDIEVLRFEPQSKHRISLKKENHRKVDIFALESGTEYR